MSLVSNNLCGFWKVVFMRRFRVCIECIGGMMELEESQLSQRYESPCDPRLNASQSLELAFLLSELFRKSLYA